MSNTEDYIPNFGQGHEQRMSYVFSNFERDQYDGKII